MRFRLTILLAFLLLGSLPALAGPEEEVGTGADLTWVRASRLPDVSILSQLRFRTIVEDQKKPGKAPEGGMIGAFRSDNEQGRFELRVSCFVWLAEMQAKYQITSEDIRLAEALENLAAFQTSIQHIDLVEEMDLPKTRTLICPEITLRMVNSVFRLSGWRLQEESTVRPSQVYAFGDVIYATDIDGAAVAQRIPPDGAPSPLTPPEIQFTAELMDLKLLYESRVEATTGVEVYAGVAIHWLRYIAQGNTEVRVFEADDDGIIRDREPMDDDQAGDYPLLSLSLRIEIRPWWNYYLTIDVQELYVYAANYTDLKITGGIQIIPYLRLQAGFRLWNVQAELYEIADSKINIDVNMVLMGFWAGVHILL
ncbi:MAG: hypothetical protein ACYTHM_01595 [Planctomycetota bacterium]|jgi:hypothetical protein